MNAQTLLLDSLNARWEKYKTELKNCRNEFSEEAVHDFRVSMRRLLAFLDMLHALPLNAKTRKARRILKDQLDNLDELRDTQVTLADISENIRDFPPLQPFKEYLQRREKKLMRAARKQIKALKITDLAQRIRGMKKAVAESKPDGLDPLPAVGEAYAKVIRLHRQIDSAQPATIHRLRIAFKKFRYMVEVIHPILEAFPTERLKQMHDYQTSMGEIQDVEAALQELTRFEARAPADYDPAPAQFYYSQRHALALSRYLDDKDEAFVFWTLRDAPDQP